MLGKEMSAKQHLILRFIGLDSFQHVAHMVRDRGVVEREQIAQCGHAIDPGFDPASLLTLSVNIPAGVEDGTLESYRVFQVPLATLTKRALEGSGLDAKSQERCKNFFALGMAYWLFSRPMESTVDWLEKKFAVKPALAEANRKVMQAGWNYCDITEAFHTRYEVEPAKLP